MKLIVFLLAIGIGFSCQKQVESWNSLKEEEQQAETSQIEPIKTNFQTKTVNGYTISVTYEPSSPEDESLHFLMEIEADGEHRTGNFLYHDVADRSDFKANVNYFNFEIINDVSVEVNNQLYNMVLSNMENTYTLDDRRKIHFVAVPPQEHSHNEIIQKISFVYDDTELGIGKTKFMFNPISHKIEN